MTSKKLREFLELAREFNLKTLKVENTLVEFYQVGAPAIPDSQLAQIPENLKMPSDEEMLYRSTSYDPAEARKEALEELERKIAQSN